MTIETWWVRLRRDGTVLEQHATEGEQPRGRARWHRVDRVGNLARETWVLGKGWTPRETAALHAAIDAGHDADHGARRRAIDQAIKEIEARIILGTLETGGRVAREAKLRGMTAKALAREIVKRADAADVETGRIAQKVDL